jgi:hypothetical protein
MSINIRKLGAYVLSAFFSVVAGPAANADPAMAEASKSSTFSNKKPTVVYTKINADIKLYFFKSQDWESRIDVMARDHVIVDTVMGVTCEWQRASRGSTWKGIKGYNCYPGLSLAVKWRDEKQQNQTSEFFNQSDVNMSLRSGRVVETFLDERTGMETMRRWDVNKSEVCRFVWNVEQRFGLRIVHNQGCFPITDKSYPEVLRDKLIKRLASNCRQPSIDRKLEIILPIRCHDL